MTRHQERVWALQILYSLDLIEEINKGEADKKIRIIKEENQLDNNDYYFEGLVIGTIENTERYNSLINEKAIDWKVDRMPYIDRNILRLALFELENDVPVGVVINEAVELAKEYADSQSAKFINGILAKIKY
ncbi:MAG: transcription antitermination factor NusB [Halanaerobiaceae bacterium]